MRFFITTVNNYIINYYNNTKINRIIIILTLVYSLQYSELFVNLFFLFSISAAIEISSDSSSYYTNEDERNKFAPTSPTAPPVTLLLNKNEALPSA